MIVQILLSLALLGLATYAFSQRARSRALAWLMMFACVAGEVFVLTPELSNKLAHVLGVGRGADLIFYCFIVVTLGLILNLHLRLRAMRDDMTELARRITLFAATEPSARRHPIAEEHPHDRVE